MERRPLVPSDDPLREEIARLAGDDDCVDFTDAADIDKFTVALPRKGVEELIVQAAEGRLTLRQTVTEFVAEHRGSVVYELFPQVGHLDVYIKFTITSTGRLLVISVHEDSMRGTNR